MKDDDERMFRFRFLQFSVCHITQAQEVEKNWHSSNLGGNSAVIIGLLQQGASFGFTIISRCSDVDNGGF